MAANQTTGKGLMESMGIKGGKMPDLTTTQNTPGPIYLPKGVGGIGKQNLSTTATEPRVVIGTGPRFPKGNPDEGPGPGAYDVKAPRGPSYTIRSREKFGSQMATTQVEVPGPGTHTRLDTGMTRRQNAPAYSLKARRVPTKTSDFTPAPGHTQHVGQANERQVLSTKPNISGMKFGTGRRDSKGTGTATGDIGPGEYGNANNVVKLSEYKAAPKYTMSGRWRDPKAYHIQPDLHMLPPGIGKQVVSNIKSAPAFSLSGRTKLGSPYG